jgi:hypothetical protein
VGSGKLSIGLAREAELTSKTRSLLEQRRFLAAINDHHNESSERGGGPLG